jgi:hypothetical protein
VVPRALVEALNVQPRIRLGNARQARILRDLR